MLKVLIMYDLKKIGERIKLIRERHSQDGIIKQADFAERLGVERDKISRIENGKQDADLKLLFGIAEQFGVSVHYLLSGEDAPKIDLTELTELKTEVRILREMLQLPSLKKKKRNIH